MRPARPSLPRGARVGLALVLLGLRTAPAAAGEDFTGFYGGVNAGGAFDRRTDRIGTGPGGTTIPASRPVIGETALPPSAAGAAAGLRDRNASGSRRPSR